MKPRPLRFYPDRAPREKFRGRSRYFRRIVQRAESFQLNIEEDSWWDYWHYHADWPGWGNRGWAYRIQHLRALCVVFRKIVNARARFRTPFQSWILINGEDAGQDCVYLHTPNKNGSPFPLAIPIVEIGMTALAPTFQFLLPDLQLEFGWSSCEIDEDDTKTWSSAHWIWARGIGEPLW